MLKNIEAADVDYITEEILKYLCDLPMDILCDLFNDYMKTPSVLDNQKDTVIITKKCMNVANLVSCSFFYLDKYMI